MLSRSPNRDSVIAEARRLVQQGDPNAAWDVLMADQFDHGVDPQVDAERRRLFPGSPELAVRIADYQRQLDDPDEKARRKAARQIDRFVRGTVSVKIARFVNHAEAMNFFIRNVDHPDPVVQESMTICIARTLDKYLHDDRAYEPLTRMTAARSITTRMWAIVGLAALTDEFIPWALTLLSDKSRKIREHTYSCIGMALTGGGTMNRPPLGPAGRQSLREAMATYDRKAPINERSYRAAILANVAEPSQLPALAEWYAKETSPQVRERLRSGIDRLQTENGGTARFMVTPP